MSLRVIGAGVGRTGTNSLKLALEALLEAPCYHMFEAMEHPDHFSIWTEAAHGNSPDWQHFLAGYAATVDSPAFVFWEELAAAFPDAPVLLSCRDIDSWWQSARATIIPGTRENTDPAFTAMMQALSEKSGIDMVSGSEDDIRTGYSAHYDKVRAGVDPARLIEWQAGDDWAPLCRALGVPVPAVKFPHVNSRGEFQEKRLHQQD